LIAALAALTLLGCGGGGNDIKQVRATLEAFARAAAHKDYATLCTRILAPALVAQLAQIGLACPAALARGLGGVTRPQLTVSTITVHGNTALARVHTGAANQRPLDTTVELQRIGARWYVRNLVVPTAAR
jgi:hypothetical protein